MWINGEEFDDRLNPQKIFGNVSLEFFNDWLDIGNDNPEYVGGLERLLIYLEYEEMYEHCALVRDKIIEVKNLQDV